MTPTGSALVAAVTSTAASARGAIGVLAAARSTDAGALSALATLVAVAFTAALFERWLARRRPHELAWAVSLALFTVASGALWLGTARGWDAPTFRVFFLFGAVLNVPYLALGTV